MASFTSRNCCAVILAAAIVALMIAAAVAPWYKLNTTVSIKVSSGSSTTTAGAALTATSVEQSATKVYFDLSGKKTTISGVCGVNTQSTYTNYDLTTNIRNVVKTSQAFVLIALITGFIILTLLFTFFFDRIRNKLIFAAGMTVTRLIAVVLAGIIVVSVLIAFLVFIGIVKAFKDDSSSCVDGPCRKFVDTTSTTVTGAGTTCAGVAVTAATLVTEQTWGPVEGWYITLGTTLPAILLLLLVVVNKFPLPIDSEASSGEAL